MSVHLEPADTLYFQRPLTGTSKVRVVIRNLESVPIVFKVKTTAPKQYSVRPNASRIDPQQVMEIQVLYQPHKQDSANDIICKDKFLIQTAILPGDKETMDMGSLWAALEGQPGSGIHQHKIKCAFMPLEESHTQPESLVNGETDKSTAAVAPQSRAAPSISSSSYRSNDTPFSVESQKPASTASDPSRRNQHDEQQEQLTEARQTIEQLRKQLDAVRQEPPTSVRPRLQYSASGRKLAPTVQPLDAVHQHLAQLERPRPTEGYPVQVVIAIAVIVFVFTYIFF